MKIFNLFLFLLIIPDFYCFSQRNIEISPSTICINIDTSSKYSDFDKNITRFSIDLSIKNKLNCSIELDSSSSKYFTLVPETIESNGYGILKLHRFDYYKNKIPEDIKKLNSQVIEIIFVIDRKKIISYSIHLNIAYGKPELVKIDSTVFDLTSQINSIFKNGKKTDSTFTFYKSNNLSFEKYLNIQNLTYNTIEIPLEADGWYDTGHILEFHNKTNLKPKCNGTIKVLLGMAHKAKFNIYGNLIIHSKDYSTIDIIFTRFYSTFDTNE